MKNLTLHGPLLKGEKIKITEFTKIHIDPSKPKLSQYSLKPKAVYKEGYPHIIEDLVKETKAY